MKDTLEFHHTAEINGTVEIIIPLQYNNTAKLSDHI